MYWLSGHFFNDETSLIIMLSAYSRNVLTRNSTSFKPCKRLIFMSSISRHTKLVNNNSIVKADFRVMTLVTRDLDKTGLNLCNL
uniref:SFRICE_014837 n=1 Tax=Spodoptera frugiperda TaxID=7108 RepID=A0A2H1VNJ1_SPOFR